MSQIPYITHETNTAAYLILQGFRLLGIQYEPRYNGKKRGFYIFEAADTIKEFADNFESGKVTVNFSEFENTKSSLLDRIKQELP